MREQAIAEYDALLSADGGLTPELFARLKRAMRERRLMYGGREIGVALRPHLLTHAQYARLSLASEILSRAVHQPPLPHPALQTREQLRRQPPVRRQQPVVLGNRRLAHLLSLLRTGHKS